MVSAPMELWILRILVLAKLTFFLLLKIMAKRLERHAVSAVVESIRPHSKILSISGG
jgi:hypothetical protein